MTRSLCVLLLAAFPALGQQAPPKLSFDAASLKPAEQVTGWIVPIKTSNPVRVTYRNYALKKAIMEAYDMARYQVEGPTWIARDRYDIVANRPRGTTEDQTRLMLQSLLAERFHLVLHAEKREIQAYALLPGRDTSKLRPEKNAPDVPGCKSFGTMPEYADMLSLVLDKPVVHQTGLSGAYYFFLVVAPDNPRPVLSDQSPGGAPLLHRRLPLLLRHVRAGRAKCRLLLRLSLTP